MDDKWIFCGTLLMVAIEVYGVGAVVGIILSIFFDYSLWIVFFAIAPAIGCLMFIVILGVIAILHINKNLVF